MRTQHGKRTGRIDDEHPEPSPSTGWREVAECMHVAAGRGEREVITVTDGEETLRRAALNPDFSKDFLEVST